ncbi:hypothetical protein KEM52_005356 [Ascosphaera acerosa]|nr:hypothetical protein KEM52_005356 [Ascosphaera acerosa]
MKGLTTGQPEQSAQSAHVPSLHVDRLPPHPGLASAGDSVAAGRPALASFLATALREAAEFLFSVLPRMPLAATVALRHPAAVADVRYYRDTLAVTRLQFAPYLARDGAAAVARLRDPRRETWVARRSDHPALRAQGTASLAELYALAHHDFLGNVMTWHRGRIDAAVVGGEWDCSSLRVEGYERISAEFCILSHRHNLTHQETSYPMVIISAKRVATPAPGYIQIQLPLHIAAMHSHPPWAHRSLPTSERSIVQQVSVQYISLAPPLPGRQSPSHPAFGQAKADVHWIAATAAPATAAAIAPVDPLMTTPTTVASPLPSAHTYASEVERFLKWVLMRRTGRSLTCRHRVVRQSTCIVPRYRYCTGWHRAKERVRELSGYEVALDGIAAFIAHPSARARLLANLSPWQWVWSLLWGGGGGGGGRSGDADAGADLTPIPGERERTPPLLPGEEHAIRITPDDKRVAQVLETARVYSIPLTELEARKHVALAQQEEDEAALARHDSRSGVLTFADAAASPPPPPSSHCSELDLGPPAHAHAHARALSPWSAPAALADGSASAVELVRTTSELRLQEAGLSSSSHARPSGKGWGREA